MRPLLNADAIVEWAASERLAIRPPDQMHVTVAYSRAPVDWIAAGYPGQQAEVIVAFDDRRRLELLGAPAVVALMFDAPELSERHAALLGIGASWDFPTYRPHVTLALHDGLSDPGQVIPYAGPLIFGPETFYEIKARP